MKDPKGKTLSRVRDKVTGFLSTAGARFGTLRFQILGIVVVSVLVPSFLAGWLASSRISNILREQVLQEIESKTERLAEQVFEWIDARASDVQDFALTSLLLQEEVRALLGNSEPERRTQSTSNVNRYIAYLLEDNQHFDAITILAPDGSTLAAQPQEADFLNQDRPAEVLGKSPVIMEIRENGSSRLAVAQRMELTGGHGSAVFTARIRKNLLTEMVTELAPPGSAAYLMDGEGHVKGANFDLEPGTKAPDSAITLLREAGTYSIYRGINGNEVIATAVPLTSLPWGIVLETSRKEAFSPLVAFRFQMIFMALALAGLFLLPALILARALVLPLEELSRVSRKIRSGKPGLQVESSARGELGEFIAAFNNMSVSLENSLEEINAANEQLRKMTHMDPLTGRHNRRHIEDYLTRELRLVARTRNPLTVLLLDLDNFKKYNDTYGHIAGDEALRQLGDILVGCVRQSDVVGRFGGEEWIVCLNYTDKEGGGLTAEKIRRTVAGNIFHLKGENTRITVSIGVATAPEDGLDYTEIIDAADSALYRAKEAGRDCVRIFNGPGSS
jgi:diguanylate cyclase (GGDEF)-like protein